MNLNEMRKVAGLPTKPEQLNEASGVSRLGNVANTVHTMQKLFTADSPLAKALTDEGADMSYFKDITKLFDKLEEAVMELQKSVSTGDE